MRRFIAAVICFFDITRNRCLECERTLPDGQLMCAGCNRGALRFMANLAIIAFALTSAAWSQTKPAEIKVTVSAEDIFFGRACPENYFLPSGTEEYLGSGPYTVTCKLALYQPLISAIPASRTVTLAPVMQDGNSRVIFISKEEATRLANLQQAVVDAEKEIATAHGVDVNGYTNPCPESTTSCRVYSGWVPRWPETFRFSGRFLLVGDVAKEPGK